MGQIWRCYCSSDFVVGKFDLRINETTQRREGRGVGGRHAPME